MRDPKSIRIVFMGTPGFAAGVLKRLIEEKYNIVAVVTVADKRAGRGKQVQQSEVKQVAEQNQIPVLQPEKLKAPEFIEELKSYKADLQIVVAFRMLPEIVWSMPLMGTFNLHASLLPQYRGAAPINRAIMNGETKTGVTTFFLQQAIDTGNVLLKSEVEIGPDENAGELHDELMLRGADLVVQTIDLIASGNFAAASQDELTKPGEVLKEAPKIFREDCRIDWKKSGEEIHDFVRGLSPYPGAWTEIKMGKSTEAIEMKIFKTSFVPENSNEKMRFPFVPVSSGQIRIEQLQIPGKKRMSADEFCRGYDVSEAELI